MIAIFLVSSLPQPPIGGPEIPDYVLHTLEFFLLALLLMRLFLWRNSPGEGGRKDVFALWQQACLLGLVIAIGYGISDEIHQAFVPGRYCSLHDVASDTLGALLAYGVAWLDYLLLNHKYYPLQCSCLNRFGALQSISYITSWTNA
ncbi:hypothetical protein GF339_16645 [candidate division KSB3 bacterium]|uniref:VanZ-like domain-containing protein n=1 Tax=candidate division KSB3 bacterium TaxID=2044937 RepID=A0A9D5Q797_9BACT|nr:hypothetical protein [candidate division KSB3 bacterium]MBD3326218.1 hypothetical protein [candidate division KSB3 bacterium]